MQHSLKITGDHQIDLRIYAEYKRAVAELPLKANGQPHTGLRLDQHKGAFHYTHLQTLQRVMDAILKRES